MNKEIKFNVQEKETFFEMIKIIETDYLNQIKKAKTLSLRLLNPTDKEFLKSQIFYYEGELINLKNIQLKISKGGLIK